MKREELTDQQEAVLKIWDIFWIKLGRQPQHTEVAERVFKEDGTPISRERARQHAEKLIEYGFLKKVVEKGEFIIKLARKDDRDKREGRRTNAKGHA